MQTEYFDSEKLWRSPAPMIQFRGLGTAIFEKLNESDPERVLEINHETGTQLSVDNVRRLTITVFNNLKRIGVKKGDVIVLYSRSNSAITPIIFGCYTLGAPVNFFETSFEGDSISSYLELLDPNVIIYEDEYKKNLFEALQKIKLSNLKQLISIDSESSEILFQANGEECSFRPPDIGDPSKLAAALMLTSGSTGKPKIIQLSHSMILLGLYNKWWDVWPESIVCSFADLRWVVQVELMLQPIFFETKRIFSSRLECSLNAEEKRSILDTHKVTHFCEVPMLYLEILSAAEQSSDPTSLSTLRKVLIAGEVVADSLEAYSKKIVPHCQVIKCYGMSEVAGVVASNEHMIDKDMNGGILKSGFCLKIVDTDGNSLGPNVSGRLILKPVVPSLGYLKNELANKKAFLDDGWYNTGDYAFFNSKNFLKILARCDELLNTAGEVIIPSVVEKIVNSHPSVLTCRLVGHSDPDKTSDEIGTIFVVLLKKSLYENVENELNELIKQNLTEEQLEKVRYLKIIPKMLLTTCGKADTKALKLLANEASGILLS